MPNQNTITLVDWLSLLFLMVALLYFSELFVCVLKLKNSNCDINPLIWVQSYTKINNVSQYAR